MPRLKPLALTDGERVKLEAWARRPKSAQRLALRSRIVLAAAAGRGNTGSAAELRVCLPTVGGWRRCLLKRPQGLADGPRPGPPRAVTGARVEDVATRTLESEPGASGRPGRASTAECALGAATRSWM